MNTRTLRRIDRATHTIVRVLRIPYPLWAYRHACLPYLRAVNELATPQPKDHTHVRTPIERLAYELAHSNITGDVTIGELAAIYSETPERIQDAIDVIQIRNHAPTTIPAVPWP
jgi:hypothetical protein